MYALVSHHSSVIALSHNGDSQPFFSFREWLEFVTREILNVVEVARLNAPPTTP